MAAVESTDWLLESIRRVERTGESARAAITRAVESIEGSRQQRIEGKPISSIVDDLMARGGRESRLKSAAAVDDFEHAIMEFRVGLIRALIDDEGLSFSEVGRRIGVSRQMVARLYRYGKSPRLPDICRNMSWP